MKKLKRASLSSGIIVLILAVLPVLGITGSGSFAAEPFPVFAAVSTTTLNITANGMQGNVKVLPSDSVSIAISVDPGDDVGVNADWYGIGDGHK